MIYKIAVCDDDIKVCGLVKTYIYRILGENYVELSIFDSGKAFMESVRQQYYDIVFLDYELNECNGLEVGEVMRSSLNRDSLLMIISSHEDKVFSLLDVEVFQFIRKPFTMKAFERSLQKAIRKLRDGYKNIVVKHNRKERFIPKREIVFIESSGRKLQIHLSNSQVADTYEKLDVFEERLKGPMDNFVRVHKSYLINLDYVSAISYRQLTLADSRVLPVSDTYHEHLGNCYLQYMGKIR